MSAGIIIQARSGSSRFPHKVLAELAGHSVLWHVIKRAFKSGIPNGKVVVATSTLAQDDNVNIEALKAGALVYRGSHSNVLKRYYDAATYYEIDPIIRVTADCPFIDPKLIHRLYQTIHPGMGSQKGYNYVCIDAMNSYPNGMDAEIFRYRDLEKEYKYSKKRSSDALNVVPDTEVSKEHVTTRIKIDPKLRRAKIRYTGKPMPNMRLTLDYKQDLVVLKYVADALFAKNPYFGLNMIIDFMSNHPEICELNADLEDLGTDGRLYFGNTKGHTKREYT